MRAMTISKSQGQSLDRAGIYLWSPVFTHGQLYVASSRTGSPDSTIYAVRSPDGMDPFITKNIVFREILSDAMDINATGVATNHTILSDAMEVE